MFEEKSLDHTGSTDERLTGAAYGQQVFIYAHHMELLRLQIIMLAVQMDSDMLYN